MRGPNRGDIVKELLKTNTNYCHLGLLGISEITTTWQKHLSTKQSIAARITSITFILYRIPLGHSFINYSKNYKRLTLIVL